MSYTVTIKGSAQKAIDALHQPIKARIEQAISSLGEDPRPLGHKKLKGREEQYRIRIGDYRVVYSIFDERLIVLVLKVAHRSSAYD